ncbi:glycoside hydrolase family 2 TIM barrel-domain containing protein [Thermoanaerobacterium sp. RBIITD]|uniref:glycoside hydrolase family 2 protein n=1 Tax=Thermoanaerobacterium sp. RBIITD TaxID=1550240 RepID=UPI000BB73E13|nr:glycoside hydrolase family 2 TIM barrel-domain containing protein [Thermoanaerobacterium sp. RBIITD]SNX53391.1 beta-glucuronidase [Thermoanaerobacterium sp. RBIITD]
MNNNKLSSEHIHNEDYDADYQIVPADWKSMINTASRKTEKLDGLWNFAIDIYDSGIRNKFFEEITKDDLGRDIPVDFNFDEWEKVKVPSNWNMVKKEYLYYEGTTWYTRKFTFYKGSPDERVFLKIGAANYECRIWLNKKLIARHIGGYTPFFVEITDFLEKENRILIMVNNTRVKNGVPALNTDWFNYGGIYRSIELIRVPKDYIKDFYIYLIPNSNFNRIHVSVEIDGEKTDDCNLIIPELGLEKDIKIDPITKKGEIEFEAFPILWSPENPKLYQVQLKYKNDKINEEIGFREIKTLGTKILLNGKEIFLKGVSEHEESIINGRAVSEEEIIENLKLVKELNGNYFRLAHYPHSEKESRLADKLGILLWEEIPVYWAIDFSNEEAYENAYNQLSELIIRDRNRASVIIWSVGNETPNTDERLNFMCKLAKRCKELDSSRLVSAACLVNIEELKIDDKLTQFLDIIGINEYYGWYDRDFNKLKLIFNNSNPKKPVIISEMGGDALAGHHGTVDELFTEECQENIYIRQFEIIDKIDYIKGVSPWILFDFRTPRRLNQFQRGFNLKGLLAIDKKYRKKAFYIVQQYYMNK